MLNFVFIVCIILEILVTIYVVNKLVSMQKEVEIWNDKLIFGGKIILQLNENLNKSITKINKFVSFFTSERFLKSIKIIKTTVIAIEIFLMIRTFNFSQGIKGNLKNLKKLFYTQLMKETIKFFCKYL